MSPHLTGVLAVVGTAFLAALLTRIQLVLAWEEQAPWWASNGRDVLNAFSVIALATSLWALGLAPGVGVVIAGHLVVLAAIVEWALSRARVPGADALAIGASVLAATPVALWPHAFGAGAQRVLFALVP